MCEWAINQICQNQYMYYSCSLSVSWVHKDLYRSENSPCLKNVRKHCRYKRTVHARCCRWLPSAQHSLRKQPRGPRHKQAEMGSADHSWHSRRSTEIEYEQNWTELLEFFLSKYLETCFCQHYFLRTVNLGSSRFDLTDDFIRFRRRSGWTDDFSTLTSSKYWDIGENLLNLRPINSL